MQKVSSINPDSHENVKWKPGQAAKQTTYFESKIAFYYLQLLSTAYKSANAIGKHISLKFIVQMFEHLFHASQKDTPTMLNMRIRITQRGMSKISSNCTLILYGPYLQNLRLFE